MSDSKYPLEPLEFDGLSTYPLSERRSKVHTGLFARPSRADDTVEGFIDTLPRILAADQLRVLIAAIRDSHRRNGGLIWGMGGHVVKTGLGPVIIDLMRRGFVTGIAMNGAASIHDFEIACCGATSEEVEQQLGSGRFGMARETGEYINRAVSEASDRGVGLGEGLGSFLSRKDHGIEFPHLDASILHEAFVRSIPVTIHLAIGTDITHIHPSVSGSDLGRVTMVDFKLLCAMVKALDRGVYVNVGSAVVLPEVFLKAVSVATNLGNSLEGLTTANLDFIQHYRPRENVLKRPTQNSGTAIALTGHHEIMLPLLAAALRD